MFVDEQLSVEEPFFKIIDNNTNEIDEKWYNYTSVSSLVDKTIIIEDKYWQKYKEFVKEEEKQDFYKLLLLIQNYLYDEFDDYQFFSENEDFSDFGLLYSTYDIDQDNDYYQDYIDIYDLSNDKCYEYEIQVSLNLHTKELLAFYDGECICKEKFKTYSDLVDEMDGCTFDSLYSYYHENLYLQKFIAKHKYPNIKDRYPSGTEIYLCSDKYKDKSIPYGTEGTVLFVDQNEQIHIEWKNGIQSCIQEDYDDFSVLYHPENNINLDNEEICL